MDVVYVHRRKNSDEIIWSIKSVRENLKPRNIFVIGDDPNVEGVIVIKPLKNKWASLSKYHDQINKYLTACQLDIVSEDFIAMNDDFFVLDKWKPVNYNRGSLLQHINLRTKHDSYTRSLLNTEKYLRSKRLPTLSYELHTPFVFNKHRLQLLIASLRMEDRQPLQIRSLYGNTYDIDTRYMEDVKNITNYKGKKLLSTNEKHFKFEPIGSYIRSIL